MKSEQNLIRAAQKDIKKFSALYELYQNKIFRHVKSRVNNDRHVADDLTSEIFEKALKNIHYFRWQGVSFSSWIYKIANNTLIDYYRKQNKYKLQVPMHDNISDKQKSIEQLAISLDLEERVKVLLHKLPDRDREILYLKFYEGYTNKAIAKKLKLSETNVGTIIYRVTIRLQKLITDQGNISV